MVKTRNLDAPEKESFPATSSLTCKWSNVFVCTCCCGKPVVVSSQCLCREKKPNLSEQVFPAGENHILVETGFSLCQNLPLKDGKGNYSHGLVSTDKTMEKFSESHSLLCGPCLVPVLPLWLTTAINLHLSFHSLIQSLNIHWFSALSQVCYFRLCRKRKNRMLRWDTLGIQRLGHLPLLKHYLWFCNSKSP